MKCKNKLTNAGVTISVLNIFIFQVSITFFKDSSRRFHAYDHFQGLSRPWVSTITSRIFQTFPQSVQTLNDTSYNAIRPQQSRALTTSRSFVLRSFALLVCLLSPYFLPILVVLDGVSGTFSDWNTNRRHITAASIHQYCFPTTGNIRISGGTGITDWWTKTVGKLFF